MMKNYEKPTILKDENLSEGVYMASGGSGCLTTTCSLEQHLNGNQYRFRVRIQHHANHTNNYQTTTIVFSVPVTCISAQEYAVSGSGSSTLTITRNRFMNGNDNADYDVYVTAASQPAVLRVSSTDGH